MKDRKTKEKKHESTIGKIIYGFLLFMPLMAIAITCMYAIFNKNANQSYSDEYIESYTAVTSQNQITANNNYQIIYDETITGNFSPRFVVSSTNLYDLLNIQDKIINSVTVILEQNYTRLNITFTDSTVLRIDNWNQQFKSFYFTLISTDYNITNTMNRCKLYQIVWNTRKISDVFYYSIDKVQESPLFNWAQNSIIYTGMNNFTTSLSITTPFIPLLMTYWLIISIVYFLYDIILIILVVLHRKIHYLEESI